MVRETRRGRVSGLAEGAQDAVAAAVDARVEVLYAMREVSLYALPSTRKVLVNFLFLPPSLFIGRCFLSFPFFSLPS